MEIKFDVYFKKNLGTLCKDNEVDLDGKEAYVNIDLNLVDRLEVNYSVGGTKYTDEVIMQDIEAKEILIPFKSDVVKVGLNEFEIVAYMKNGDIKVSQTYTYNIEKSIGEGRQASDGDSSDGHTHNNLNVLNSITQSKVSEWDNKADRNHTHSEYASATHSHSEYASNSHTHNASEIEGLENVDIDLSDYYTKSETYNRTEIDNKIANMGTGGSVDLSNYYTKSETDEVVNNKADKVHTHSEYLTELPSHEHEQYLTEHQDISHKADKENTYTKSQTDNKIGNKTYRYLTQNEYNSLPNEDKNNESIVYFITDAKEDVFTLSLDGNRLSLLKNGISVSSVVIPTSSNDGSDAPGEGEGGGGTGTPDEGEGGGGTGTVEYTNLIFNDDTFVNPSTSNAPSKNTYFYFSANTVREVNDGVLRMYTNEETKNTSLMIRCGYGDNKIYYHQFKVKSDTGIVAGSPQNAVLTTNRAVEDWTLVSYIYTDTSPQSYSMKVASNDNGKLNTSVYFKEPMRICLTDIFGSGNEPSDVKVCDEMFATFVPGQRGY